MARGVLMLGPMLRASFFTLLASVGFAAIAGCHGPRPIQGEAVAEADALGGRVVLTKDSAAASVQTFGDATLLPDGPAPTTQPCDASLSGRVDEDHTSWTTLEVSCRLAGDSGDGEQRLRVLVPDVRVLAAGDVAPLVVDHDYLQYRSGGDCRGRLAVQATLSIEQAAGGASPAPAFVSADFVRVGRIELEVDKEQLVATSSSTSGCAQPFDHLSLRASFRLASGDYSQSYEFEDGPF
jgi:hypothetical protein